MSQSISVPIGYLRAAILFAAKKDVRQYLKGVAIARGIVTASDGRSGCGIHIDQGNFPESIIPREVLDSFLKRTKAFEFHELVTIQRDGGTGTLSMGGSVETFQYIDQDFPDMHRVLPTHREAGEHAQLPPSQLVLFDRAAEALGAKKGGELNCVVLPNGQSGARVVIPVCPDFNGVIMAIRENHVKEALAQAFGAQGGDDA